MIRVLLAIQFGLTVAAVFAILDALAPEPPRQRQQSELTKMILDAEERGKFLRKKVGDMTIMPEEIREIEMLLDITPFSMVLTGIYDDVGWPFETITEDAKN